MVVMLLGAATPWFGSAAGSESSAGAVGPAKDAAAAAALQNGHCYNVRDCLHLDKAHLRLWRCQKELALRIGIWGSRSSSITTSALTH